MSRKLTSKQEAYKNYRLQGENKAESYRQAYNAENMSDNAIYVAACELDKHPLISLSIEEAKKKATERALVTVEDVVKGLLKETGEDVAGSTHSGRVAAWKGLGEHTGGFDTNKHKLEHSGNVIYSEMSDEQLDAKLKQLLSNGQKTENSFNRSYRREAKTS